MVTVTVGGISMLSVELDFLQSQLEERKRRLETAIARAPDNANAEALLREVDSALDRFAGRTACARRATNLWSGTGCSPIR